MRGRSRISRKRKNLIRKWSRDNEKLTDEQQVARAEARARYPPLMVKDLFSVFGIYHNFFWLSILLNSLMWSMGAVHYDMVRVLTLRREDYEATDAEKMVYKPHRDFEPFHFPPALKYLINQSTAVTEIVGPLYILLRYSAGRRRLMLESCLLYTASSCLSLFTYNPILRLSIALTSFFNRTIRYVSIMHLSESIPPRLLPLAFGIMGVSDCVFSSVFEISITFMSSWRYLVILIGLLVGCAGLLYYVYVPPAILLDITLKDGNKVQDIITTTLHDSDIIDVDALIDDTIFAGRVIVSPWKRAAALLRVANFRNKYLFLVVLQTAQSWIYKTANASLKGRAGFGLTEFHLIAVTVQGLASLLGVAFIYRFGRRCTIMLHILTSLLGVVFLGAVRLEKFDVCIMKDISNDVGKVLAGFWAVLLVYCSRVLKIVIRLALIQHIPVEDHTTLFALAMIASATLKTLIEVLVNQEWLAWHVYPSRVYIISLAIVVLFAPTVVFMDNCATMPLMSTDYKAYHLRQRPWNKDPKMADEPTHEEG